MAPTTTPAFFHDKSATISFHPRIASRLLSTTTYNQETVHGRKSANCIAKEFKQTHVIDQEGYVTKDFKQTQVVDQEGYLKQTQVIEQEGCAAIEQEGTVNRNRHCYN
jgi:hypothetical protein